jgi:hypothetical protein
MIKIINKKIKPYRRRRGDPDLFKLPARVAEDFDFIDVITSYILETPQGNITYRGCSSWTCIVRCNGRIDLLNIQIKMNEDNPQETLEKFESLLVLK